MTEVVYLWERSAALMSVSGHCRAIRWCIVDAELVPYLARYSWYVGSAGFPHPSGRVLLANGQTKRVRLHRLLAKARRGQRVIHLNGNTLDCRRANLKLTSDYSEPIRVVEEARARERHQKAAELGIPACFLE